MDMDKLKPPPNCPLFVNGEFQSPETGRSFPLTWGEYPMSNRGLWKTICAVAALYWQEALDDSTSFSLESEEADDQCQLWYRAAFEGDEP